MAKLQMLKHSVQMVGRKVQMAQQTRNPEAEQRVRGRKWMSIRARWLGANPLCVACIANGYTRPANRLDHIVPLIDGGRDDESNYQSLCASCHDEKTAQEAKARSVACAS